MTSKQLVAIRDSMQKIVDEYDDKLSNDTKVDFHDAINFLSNILHDVELELKRKRVTHTTYMLNIEITDDGTIKRRR